jgi:hypothetical protein
MKRNRQKRRTRRTRRIRLTKKYKAGGWKNPVAWWRNRQKQKLEEQLEEQLRADFVQSKSKLTDLFAKIEFDKNLDWVLYLDVKQGVCVQNGHWKLGIRPPPKGTQFDCLKISNEKYDQFNLLQTIWDFLHLQQQISNLEKYDQVPEPTDPQDFSLYERIQYIVEKFLKLRNAHLQEESFHNYIRNDLNKVPNEIESIKFEEKYYKSEWDFAIFDTQDKSLELEFKLQNKTFDIYNLLLKINQVLPDKFRTIELVTYKDGEVPEDLLYAFSKEAWAAQAWGPDHLWI